MKLAVQPKGLMQNALDKLIEREGLEVRSIELDGERWYDALDWVSAISGTADASSYWHKLKGRMEVNRRGGLDIEGREIDVEKILRRVSVRVEGANGVRTQARDYLNELGVYLATLLMRKGDAVRFRVDAALLMSVLGRSKAVNAALQANPELSLVSVDIERRRLWAQREREEPNWVMSRTDASLSLKMLVDEIRALYGEDWDDQLNVYLADEVLSGVLLRTVEVAREQMGIDESVDLRDYLRRVPLQYLTLAQMALRDRIVRLADSDETYSQEQLFEEAYEIGKMFGEQMATYERIIRGEF